MGEQLAEVVLRGRAFRGSLRKVLARRRRCQACVEWGNCGHWEQFEAAVDQLVDEIQRQWEAE
jgi:hypothetical protein